MGSIVEIRMAAASGFSVVSDWTQHHAPPALRSAYIREQQHLYHLCRKTENEGSILAWLSWAFLQAVTHGMHPSAQGHRKIPDELL